MKQTQACDMQEHVNAVSEKDCSYLLLIVTWTSEVSILPSVFIFLISSIQGRDPELVG
jgi:hypothetical protein